MPYKVTVSYEEISVTPDRAVSMDELESVVGSIRTQYRNARDRHPNRQRRIRRPIKPPGPPAEAPYCDLDKVRLREKRSQLPEFLYRVTYDEAVTTRVGRSFVANNFDTVNDTNEEFRASVVSHLSWESDKPSPFISALDDLGVANMWAHYLMKLNEKGEGKFTNVKIVKISTLQCWAGVYRVRNVCRELNILEEEISPMVRCLREYFLLWNVDGRAVVDTILPSHEEPRDGDHELRPIVID